MTVSSYNMAADIMEVILGEIGIYVGAALMLAGVLLFVLGRRKRGTAVSSNGSVSVGGDNSGSIVNINQTSGSPKHGGGHGLTIVAMVVELIGIGVTLWHAYHLAHLAA